MAKVDARRLRDAVLDALVLDLREMRRRPGLPSVVRLEGLDQLVDVLGGGNVERTWESIERLRRDHGQDAESAVGAFFFTAGWAIGLDTLDQRLTVYAERYHVDPQTARRRSDRGIRVVAQQIRDGAELARPWGVISVFQSGDAAQVVLDFHLAFETLRPPVIHLNGDVVETAPFRPTPDPHDEGGFWFRLVLPECSLDLDVGFAQEMLKVRVDWAMPIWPTWQVLSWTADPRLMTRLRTFRARAAEMTIEWWRHPRPAEEPALVRDRAIWTARGGTEALESARRVRGSQT